MAVAAFKSTTKRSCRISSWESDGASLPDAPSSKRGLMRMKSLPGVSSRYLSDSSSSPDYLSRAFSRHLPSDSESEVDGGYSSSTKGRSSISEFGRGIEESVNHRSDFHSGSSKRRSRLASHQGSSQASKQGVSRFGRNDADTKVLGDQFEAHEIEERTIPAVHAEMKSIERDPPTGDTMDVYHIYEIIREEVRRAVATIREELEESFEKGKMMVQFGGSLKSPVESVDAEKIEVSSNIHNRYAAKLHQSQERAQELRLQLEEEERRVIDLTNSVNGLRINSGSKRSCTQIIGGVEKQLVSSLLEEDAHIYFKECVSIANLEPPEVQRECTDGNTSSHVKTKKQTGDIVASGSKPPEHPVAKESSLKTSRDNSLVSTEYKVKRRPVNVDGVVMPWLDCDWNIDSRLQRKQDDSDWLKEEVCWNGAEVKCSPSIANVKNNEQEKTHEDSQKVQDLKCQASKTTGHYPAYVHDAISDSLLEMDSCQANGLLFKLNKTNTVVEAQNSLPRSTTLTESLMQFTGKIDSSCDNKFNFGADHILMQRRRLKSKIARGGLLLCGGK